jgi:hypothetical protein
MKAFTIIRVSGEDQLRGYGPDSQWADDVVPNAPSLGLEVSEDLRRVIQEPATTWDREKFETAVREALDLYQKGVIQALIFPRVDRETRFIFGSMPLLAEVVKSGLRVYFAREKLALDANDPESIERYLSKATQAQAYIQTMRLNTIRGRRKRAERDHMMPTARSKWAHDYHPYRRDWGKIPDATSGRYTVNTERATWVRQWANWILVDGLSTNRCCRLMAEKYRMKLCRSTIVDVLSDPAMLGKFYAYGTTDLKNAKGKRKTIKREEKDWLLVYDDPEQAILSSDQFYALKEQFRRNRENSPRHAKHWYPPLRSLIFHSCGRRMVGTYRNTQPLYRCLPCGSWLKAAPLWDQIQSGIKERLLDPERLIPGIEAQLDSGQSVSHLEDKLRSINQRMDTLDQADQKALRLHLYLPDYPPEKLEAETRRLSELRQRLAGERTCVQKELTELRQAIVDKDGLRRFCETASRNLVSFDDSQWRLLLEAMHLQVLVDNETITVKVAVPAVVGEKSAIVFATSASLNRHFTGGRRNILVWVL